MPHNFRKLDIWIDGVDLADKVYSMTSSFPTEERFGLTSQMQRAVVSVPSNIAEGSAKDSDKDFCRFLGISLGSLYELETQLEIAHRRSYMEEAVYSDMLEKIIGLQRRIFAFRQHLNASDAN